MEYELPPETATLKKTVRAFVDRELIPDERRLSRTHKVLPDDRVRLEAAAKSAGLWNLNIPRKYGGHELNLLGRTVVWEEFARTIALPSRNQSITGPDVSPILYHLPEELQAEFLLPVIRGEKRSAFAQTEPEAGSDPGGMQTTAVRDGDNYVINGRKRFIGFADEVDFIQVFAATDKAKGSRGGITGFLVPVETPGLIIARQMETMMRDRPFELTFENCRVPVAYRIGEEGAGFAFAQSWLTEGRIRHAARGIGVIERCIELGVKRAQERKTFGAPLAERQAIQWMLVDMYVHLKQLRLMTYTTAARHDAGHDVRFDSYSCKFVGDETSFAAADRCMQIYGGLGLTTDTPIETFWRDQRSMIITEGPTEVLKMALSRHILKEYGGR
ncbi:MAG TPA: acyl-CoA dehydrogenase family protein [Candidatus Lustribacter sp.]